MLSVRVWASNILLCIRLLRRLIHRQPLVGRNHYHYLTLPIIWPLSPSCQALKSIHSYLIFRTSTKTMETNQKVLTRMAPLDHLTHYTNIAAGQDLRQEVGATTLRTSMSPLTPMLRSVPLVQLWQNIWRKAQIPHAQQQYRKRVYES